MGKDGKLTVGILASNSDFQRHATGVTAIRVFSKDDVTNEIEVLLLHFEDDDERIGVYSAEDYEIAELIELCKAMRIPTVLYIPDYAPTTVAAKKSDNDAFDRFENLIKACNVVLIGDELYVDHAKAIKGDNSVYQSQPLFCPLLCNPVGLKHASSPVNEIGFDSSYYESQGYLPDNIEYLDEIEKLCEQRGITMRESESVRCSLQRASWHKEVPLQLGVNCRYFSSDYIPTSYCEIYACGGLLLTNYTKAVNRFLQGSFVYVTPEETQRCLSNYSSQDLVRFQAENVIIAYEQWSSKAWYKNLLELLDLGVTIEKRKIYVVVDEKDDKSKEAFLTQAYHEKEMISCSELSEELLSNLGQNSVLTVFSAEHDYDISYLSDFAAAFEYSETDVISKQQCSPDHYYSYCFGNISLDSSAILVGSLTNGKHTEIKPGVFMTQDCRYLQLTDFFIDEEQKESDADKKVGIIIPVFNNGNLLYYRCFRSILRSTVFSELQLYFIDDGSTDKSTHDILESLCRRYDNVTTYFFSDGGSGAAGRPRNKGIDICNEEWIAFEDPDDETIDDAYAAFIREAEKDSSFDLISTRGQRTTFQYGVKTQGPLYLEDVCQLTPVIDISELPDADKIWFARTYCDTHLSIIKKTFFIEKTVGFIEGFHSEDNLLMLQLLEQEPKICSLAVRKCLYYAENEGSATNTNGLMKLLSRWIPGTNLVFRHLRGKHFVYYAARNVLREADSSEDIQKALVELSRLYEGTGESIFDYREEWLLSFLEEDFRASRRIAEYYEKMDTRIFI